MRVLVVCLVILLAGCGSKGGGEAFQTPDKDGDVYVIHLTEDREFEPGRAKVPGGAIVSFHFGLSCDVRSQEPGGPDSRTGRYATGIYPSGESFNWFAPSDAQEFHIFCSRHESQGMTAVLRIV